MGGAGGLQVVPHSLHGRLALGIAILFAVLAVALSVALGAYLAHVMRQDAGAALHAVARVAGVQLVEGLALRARAVQGMAESRALWSEALDSERVLQMLARSQAMHPHSVWIGVTDGNGLVEAATGGLEIDQLPDSLTAMTDRMQQANSELEQRVLERTEALARANVELEQLAQRDPLTGLLNPRRVDARVELALAAARRRQAPLSSIVVDADHFKHVNDRNGHDVGDTVLKQLATTLRGRLRATDIVGRLGGEEFVAVLADTGAAGAGRLADDLVESIGAMEVAVVGRVTVSCGVVEMGVGEESTRDAMTRADVALYRAKQTGRNRWCSGGDELAAPEPKLARRSG